MKKLIFFLVILSFTNTALSKGLKPNDELRMKLYKCPTIEDGKTCSNKCKLDKSTSVGLYQDTKGREVSGDEFIVGTYYCQGTACEAVFAHNCKTVSKSNWACENSNQGYYNYTSLENKRFFAYSKNPKGEIFVNCGK